MNKDLNKHEGKMAEDLYAIGFRIGKEEYGIPLSSVQEVIAAPRITRVPKAPNYIVGVINLHGNVIPVIDIARRLDIGNTKIDRGARVVVIDSLDESIGLLAESVSKVSGFIQSEMQPPPPLVAGIAAEYLEGVMRIQDHFLIFLNLQKTLNELSDN